MKRSLIVIKPFDVKLPPDCIKDCWSNHDRVFGAIHWQKGGTLQRVTFEYLKDIEAWAAGLDENSIAFMHFGGRIPIKDAAMPFLKEKGDDWIYYFHSGDLDVVNSIGNEDLALYDAFFAPISPDGIFNLATELAKNPKNGQFLLYNNKDPFVHKLGEGWEVVDGIEYSNSEHKKKVSFPSYLTPPAIYSQAKEKEKTPPEEIEFFGLRLTRPLEGISRYFGLPPGTIARVVSSKNPLFQPMDWVLTVAGHEFAFADLPDFIRKKSVKKRINLHMRILRIDQIAYCRGEKTAKKELHLQLEHGDYTPDTDAIETLNDAQRRFMIVQLLNRIFKNEDLTIKHAKRIKFESSPDSVIIQMCEDYDINDWKLIS